MANTRTCGTCTLCCKLVAVAELTKPTNKWCDYCAIGIGCRIYDKRPQSCADYRCMWLNEPEAIPEEFRPDKVKCVITVSIDGPVVVYVDPNRPDAWKTGKFGLWLETLSKKIQVVVLKGRAQMPEGKITVAKDGSTRFEPLKRDK